MRVTLVTETYFPQVNGVSRTLCELVRFLRRNGDDIQLISPDYGVNEDHEHVHTVRSIVLPFYRELRLPLPPFGSVHRAIEAFQPDIIHIATEATLGLSVLRRALRRRQPVVSSFHTNFDQYSRHYNVGWSRGAIWRYLRWFHNNTKETYVPSLATIDHLKNIGFERVVLWRRGVDSSLFRPKRPGSWDVRRTLGWAPDAIVITYVSRMAAEKNVDYLADALAIVASRRPEVRLLMVGDGPSRPALEGRIGSIAHFAGYVQGEALSDHYATSDIFAFPSLTETFGNVVLEAMASGLPVVGLRSGGVGEIVQQDVTGILVDSSEPAASFASAILRLVEHPEQRLAMALAAREYALSQSWDTVMGALRKRYQRVIDERTHKPSQTPTAH